MATIPTFETKRLILRELIESDSASYQKYFVNYEVIRYLAASVPWPYPDGGVLSYLRSDVVPNQGKDRWVWAITLRHDPSALIGAIELIRCASPANRGFWLGQPFWGKGYMTEAVEPITDYAFRELRFNKLIFANAIGNKRSGRVKEKSGAQWLRRESAKYVDPSLTERDIYELSREAWLDRGEAASSRVIGGKDPK